jgi:hypothetical protein
MSAAMQGPPPDRIELLRWVARLGAVPATALAAREGTTVPSARARLAAAEGRGMLERRSLLAGRPALYTITRAGLRASGLSGLSPMRVSAGGAEHAIACATAAVALERAYPEHRLLGEPELRRMKAGACGGAPRAALGRGADGRRAMHRPDLALWPIGGGLPVAVEIELTVKAPRRLLEICRGWARCREVSGVLYLASAPVLPPLRRAIEEAGAAGSVVALPLTELVIGAGPKGDQAD